VVPCWAAWRTVVLPICLAEARRCRPYFIGLLGERYGSVLNQFDRNVLAQEPWLAGQEGRSVTNSRLSARSSMTRRWQG
jgi:hypothetical protein